MRMSNLHSSCEALVLRGESKPPKDFGYPEAQFLSTWMEGVMVPEFLPGFWSPLLKVVGSHDLFFGFVGGLGDG